MGNGILARSESCVKVADRLKIHFNALIFIFVNIVNDKRDKRSICAWEEVIKD